MKKIFIIFSLLTIIIISCTDNSTNTIDSVNGNSRLKIYLVDAPASLDSVIIFVNRVEVHKSDTDSTSGWFVINDTPGTFDLLELTNGANAVLGDTSLPAGSYTQIRLILDEGSYVISNGVKYPLTVPSGTQTGIKLNHPFTLEANALYELVLDFDADKSIHTTGSGKYMLKPVIRVSPIITSGSISGYIMPLDADAKVFTTIGDDTVTTYPDTLGFFKLMVLPQDTYDVEIHPQNNAYKDSVVENINVYANQNTDLGTIELETN